MAGSTSRGPIRIPNFDRYAVHPDGRIEHVATGNTIRGSLVNGRVQAQFVHDEGTARCRGLASMILRTLVGPPEPGQEASHLDGDPWNNHPDNLRWETHAENMARKREHGTVLSGDRHGKTKLSDDQAREIHRRANSGERGIDLAAEFGVTPQCITDIKKGRRVCLAPL